MLASPLASAAAPERGVAQMAAANLPASRTGIRTATEEPAPPSTTAVAPSVGPYADRILEILNAERTSRGLQPLAFESRLVDAAMAHTQHQASLGMIFHYAPDGTGPGERISATGYTFSTWGENVAAGQTSPESVMTAWMESPGHCKNILNPQFTEIGVAFFETSDSYRTWWTQKFARPQGVPVPPGTYDPAWC